MTTHTAPSVTEERLAAEHTLDTVLNATRLTATREDWHTTHTSAGVLLSARVSGEDAARAVQVMTEGRYRTVPPFQHAHLDYSVPGRVACVWRSAGVWFELWHDDTVGGPVKTAPAPVLVRVAEPAAAPGPVPVPRPTLLSRASGRLPFTRRRKETYTA